jgi:hypothetical protein
MMAILLLQTLALETEAKALWTQIHGAGILAQHHGSLHAHNFA